MIDLSAESQKEFHDDPFRRNYRIVLFFVLLGLCAFTRLWGLDWKSMMHDELLFAQYTYNNMYEAWNYSYQPILHGPMMLHLQNVVFHIFGVSDYTVRLGCALLGVFGFFWIWKLRYWLNEVGTWVALLFYTLSPGISYYQRFFRNDSLFLFTTLWIVASLANWWRTKDGKWAASAILGSAVLFANKESSLFVYFSIFTFLLLVVLNDLAGYFLEGKRTDLQQHLKPAPRFPALLWPVLITGGIVLLCLTHIFEGMRYASDVRKAIGHDWVLSNVRSIPLALGWGWDASGEGAIATTQFWKSFYVGLFTTLFLAFGLFKIASKYHIGRSEFVTRLWERTYDARWYIVGAIAGGVAIYLLVFTTFFKHRLGFFEIYERTWSYWGGQHEWGRIGGPFHQHLLNIAIYEFPAMVAVMGAWIIGLFRIKPSRTLGVAFLAMAVAFGAFHSLIFSGVEVIPPTSSVLQPINVYWLKNIFWGAVIVGFSIIFFPRAGKALIPLSFAVMVLYSMIYINSEKWAAIQDLPIYKDGEAVELMDRHVNFGDFVEIQYNFDAGWNLALVIGLIFFATLYAWNAISKGDRFHGFLIWWTVTAFGAASYAREAVPQIGIHAMLPLILLAASYTQRLVIAFPRVRVLPLAYIVIGALALWNAKAAFNLNFYHGSDPRERMVYGPNHPDVKHHMDMVRDYHDIASLRMADDNTAQFVRDYNAVEKHKDVRVLIKPIDAVSWSAKWYLRDIEYTERGNPKQAIEEGWEFLFLAVGDKEKYPQLEKKYNIQRGRGTVFWQPNPIDMGSLGDVWKGLIPGHYINNTPQASDLSDAKEDWNRIRRYLLLREIFEGTNRNVPSMSSLRDYLFCYRKDLY